MAYGLIDSGNCLENALSLDLFHQLGLTKNHLEPYHIPRVGTARKGTYLNIKGRLKHPLTFIVGTRGQTLKIRPVVIEGLSMGLNISGPYLAKRGIDQIHSKNSLLLDGKLLPLVSYRHQIGVASLPSEITSSHLQEYPLFMAQDQVIPPWSQNVVDLEALGLPQGFTGIIHGNTEFMRATDFTRSTQPSPTQTDQRDSYAP